MFERLILCEYAVADLTTANANVFYELGVRHAVRPFSTVLLFAEGGSRLPFDVAPLRAMPYRLTPEGTPAQVEADKKALVERLERPSESPPLTAPSTSSSRASRTSTTPRPTSSATKCITRLRPSNGLQRPASRGPRRCGRWSATSGHP